MAVYTTGGGGGLLGGLGALATIGGALTGQPWLGALGTGLNAVNSMMKGGGVQSAESLASALDELLNSWKNPVSGNIAKTPYQADASNWMRMRNMQKPSWGL